MIPKALKNDEIVFSGKIIPSVVDVDYLGGHSLYLEFDDGRCGEIDFLPYIERIQPLHELKDEKRFTQFLYRMGLSLGRMIWMFHHAGYMSILKQNNKILRKFKI